jgi:methyl-accepting chemotaxis protein
VPGVDVQPRGRRRLIAQAGIGSRNRATSEASVWASACSAAAAAAVSSTTRAVQELDAVTQRNAALVEETAAAAAALQAEAQTLASEVARFRLPMPA